MEGIKSLVQRLVREEEGASAVEYAILVAVIVGVVVAAVQQFDLGGIFGAVSTKAQTAVTNAGTTTP